MKLMGRMTPLVIVLSFLTTGALAAVTEDAADAPNAARKVVTLLEKMKAQVAKDAEADLAAYDEYKCFCETNLKDKDASIKSTETKITWLKGQISILLATIAQLKMEIASLLAEIAELQQSLAEAVAIREKEAAEFARVKAELMEGITGLTQAIAALSKVQLLQKSGHGSSSPKVRLLLLQAHDTLKGIQINSNKFRNVMQKDFFDVMNVLGGSSSSNFLGRGSSLAQQKPNDLVGNTAGAKSYNSRSGEIYGILQQMLDGFKKDLAEAQQAENEAIAAFLNLKASLMGQISAAQAQLDAKYAALSAAVAALARLREDLTSTTGGAAGEQQFLMTLARNCKLADQQYAARVKGRDNEMMAISETIEILTGDEARALFAKTLSFLQIHGEASAESAMQKTMNKAMQRIMLTAKKNGNWLLAGLAVRMKLDPFIKVKSMMDKMMADLKQQQADEYSKNNLCVADIAKTEKKIQGATDEQNDAMALEGKLKGEISKLEQELGQLKEEVAANQKSLKEAGKDRKTESIAYQQALTDQRATVKVLTMAYDRLKKFYATPSASLAQISTHANGTASFAQVSTRVRSPVVVSIPRPMVGGCAGVLCPEDICPDGKPRRQVGDECCSCESRPLVGGCAGVLCDMCPDGSPAMQVGDECCSCGSRPVVGGCAGVLCPKDICPDGLPRRQVGSDCCSCESRPLVGGCAGVMCSQDICPDGLPRRQVGSDCCSCESRPLVGGCPGVMCPQDICPDGKPRRQVGSDCCSCDAVPVVGGCPGVMCPQDICPDGKPRRQVGSDCCSCKNSEMPVKGGCDGVMCSQDICPDGKPRRQVGDDCCSCGGTTIVMKPMPADNYEAHRSGGGVMQMIGSIIQDAEGQASMMTGEEQQAQAAYEQLTAATAASIQADQEAILEKTKLMESATADLAETSASLFALDQKLSGLAKVLAAHHADCDWLVKYFDTRQTARKEEMDAIEEAKAILSGASFGEAFLQ